jgi:HSP20 family molecular chaperone IbpA
MCGKEFAEKGRVKRQSDIDRLQDEVQGLIDDLWHVPRFARGRRGFRPLVDCIRSEEPAALHVVVELPGVDPKSIQVVLADRMLVVAGERRPPLKGRYQQMEIEYVIRGRG